MLNIWAHYNATAFLDEHRHIVKRKYFFSVLLGAVAVSDTINGVGLLIVGLLVPVLGLVALGDGSFSQGLSTIATTETEKLNAIGGPDDPVPFGTIFTLFPYDIVLLVLFSHFYVFNYHILLVLFSHFSSYYFTFLVLYPHF